eukprot:symbB.v1.2.020662.t1/scaffold1748.1/size222129/10
MAEQQGAQMQNQLNQLMTQVQRLTGELQDSGQRETTLVERLNQVAQQQAQMRVESNLGPLVDAITESQKQVVAALQKDKKLTLVDNRGVAKPDKFGSKDEGFLRWKTRTESFILSVFPELEEALTWAEEHETSITKADVDAEFGATTAGEIEEIHDKSAQGFAVLQNLLEGAAFTIVRNCPKGNGMEAWRKINKRYDPATGSRKGSLLRHILSPAKSKLEDLTGNLEVWLDLISRYENRKDPSGTRLKFQDEIKIAVLEQICPTELERHLQMSKARLKTFEDHGEEIMSFLGTREWTRHAAHAMSDTMLRFHQFRNTLRNMWLECTQSAKGMPTKTVTKKKNLKEKAAWTKQMKKVDMNRQLPQMRKKNYYYESTTPIALVDMD